VGLHFSDYADYTSPAQWDVIQRSGADRYRANISKPIKDPGSWQPYDSLFEHAAARGISIVPVLYGWQGGSGFYPGKAEYSAWQSWVIEVVQRYGQNGSFWVNKANPLPPDAWEVWNEPNLAENNPGGTNVQPQNYANFLQATSDAIKAVQPSAKVLFGGLFSAATNQKPNGEYSSMNVRTFLEAAHAVPGTSQAFTALSLHPYAFKGDQVASVKSNIEFARSALSSVPGGNVKGIWITELGWPILGDENHPGVLEQTQATLLTNSFNMIKNIADANGIQTVIWYFFRDTGLAWNKTDGLRRLDGTYRPSWWAFQDQTGAGPWPWYTDNLGGTFQSDPGISSWGANRLDVFARGKNTSKLFHKYWDWNTGGWLGWEDMGGALTSGVDAVSWGPGRIDVVARTTDSSVQHWYWMNGWYSDNLGGAIEYEPGISSWGANRLDVFVRDWAAKLAHKWWHWPSSSWIGWENMGGNLTSGVDAVSWGPNRIDVVARTTNNSVQHWYWTGSSWASDNLGGNITSKPAISSRGPNRLDVFARGIDNALWHKWWNGSAWSEWQNLGGVLTSGPSAVSWNSNRIDVVALTTGDSVQHWYWAHP